MRTRPRFAEWVAGLSALALIGFLYLDWFTEAPATVVDASGATTYTGTDATATGWESLGWLALGLCVLAIVAGLALVLAFSFAESPVLPVLAAILTTLLGGLAAIALVVQAIFQPGEDSLVGVMSGWWLGFLAACGIARGGFLSMRDEYLPGVDVPDAELRPAPAA